MKILAVADTHGERTPLKIAQKYLLDVDKVVFLGDYTDSFLSKWPEQKIVLKEILQFKKDNSQKVELLLGNHDLAYLADEQCSGHQNNFAVDIKEFFEKHLKFFNIIFVHNNWIFSHAGISQVWWNTLCTKISPEIVYEVPNQLTILNDLLQSKQFHFFQHCSYDPTGDSKEEGPLWIRPNSLVNFGLPNCNQIVGHTELHATAPRFHEMKKILEKVKDYPRDSIPMQYKLSNGELREDRYVFLDSVERNTYAILENDNVEIFQERL